MPTHAGASAPTEDARPATRRWPVTLVVVVAGVVLLGWEVAVAVVNTASFFGEQPSRDRLVETGMLLATSAVPVALACVVGLLLGSRWGLLLLAVPGVVVSAMGVDLMGRTGGGNDPERDRPVRWSDAFQDLTRPNWVAAAVLLGVLGLVLARRRRRRQTGIRADHEARQGAT